MITLAMPYHDPYGLNTKVARLKEAMPIISNVFDNIICYCSEETDEQTIGILEYGCECLILEPQCENLINEIGKIRRLLLDFSVYHESDHILYCDGDRAVYWANNYPDELKNCVNNIHLSDFTVYGRTNRAWLSHPDAQKTTESIIDKMFAVKTGLEWDVLAAARGISSKAAKFIVENSKDNTFGVDVSWPIMTQQNSDIFSMSYVRVDGLGFEGINRDDEIEEWIHRSKIVQVELEAML